MRAVVLQGAVVTPAAMRESCPRTRPECDEIGYHDHVYWCCPAVAEKLGWTLATADSEQGDDKVINWNGEGDSSHLGAQIQQRFTDTEDRTPYRQAKGTKRGG